MLAILIQEGTFGNWYKPVGLRSIQKLEVEIGGLGRKD